MTQYLPWSERVLEKALESYINGNIPTLNLELTAKCSLGSCLYCDSKVGRPYENELDLNEISRLIRDLRSFGLKWVFICGLGEPREDPSFFEVLRLLKENQIDVSFFTNGLYFEEDEIELLIKYNVNMLVKLDSFDSKVFDCLLGRVGAARRVYRFVEDLLRAGFVRINEYDETNLAFSIVPTKLNIATIPEVIRFCKEHDIFPCIGEMEYANKAIKNWGILAVTKEELKELLQKIDEVLGCKYKRNLCQGIIPSIHISNVGKCIVEARTGLSCGWFLQEDMKYKEMGSIRKDSIESIISNVNEYRWQKLGEAERLLSDIDATISFGGGAKPRIWCENYIKTMRARKVQTCRSKNK